MFEEPPPPKPDAPVAERLAWMRARVHAYVQDLALEAVIDPNTEAENRTEAFVLAIELGLKAKATADEIMGAFDAEWMQDTQRAAQMLAHLRAALWKLCRANSAKRVVEDKASEVMERWRVFVPQELLHPVLHDIWVAAQPYEPIRGRRRGR